jgi:hypothetical protein
MVDSSEVVGEVAAKVDAPEPDAVQWLRRTDTKGGVAPKTGCDASRLS